MKWFANGKAYEYHQSGRPPPQRDRRPRLIVDFSFSDVNEDTVLLAQPEAMQFGMALHRVLRSIVDADVRYGPVYPSKIDNADGFFRFWLRVADIPKLGVVLLTTPGQPPLIAFPLTLPMGWVESPPYYFTVLTETVCDLANDKLRSRSGPPSWRDAPHRLEAVAATPPPDLPTSALTGKATPLHERPLSEGRPPVDDFLFDADSVNSVATKLVCC